MVELPIETQINILKKARYAFAHTLYSRGLCYVLDCEIKLLIKKELSFGYEYIEKLIPLFTWKNAYNSVGIEGGHMTGYWWRLNNKEKRIEFIDWMINRLENMANID